MFMSDIRGNSIVNVLSDVGGVTFTFDNEKRKEIWVREAGRIIQRSLVEDKAASEILPPEFSEAISAYHGGQPDVDCIFRRHVHELAGTINEKIASDAFAYEAGERTLTGMLQHPIPTAMLEHIQGEALRNGELVAQPIPGIKELIGYVHSVNGSFKGYSTGAPKMPDQFHEAVGLNGLVGSVRTTYPGHAAKQRSAEDILDEARKRYETGVVEDTEMPGLSARPKSRAYFWHAFIDDSPNEAGIWAEARKRMEEEDLGSPAIYLLRRELPEEATGIAETAKGRIFVVNSLDRVRRELASPGRSAFLRRTADYEIDFGACDKKFG